MEYSLNDDEEIDTSVVPEGETESYVVVEVHEDVRTVGVVGE